MDMKAIQMAIVQVDMAILDIWRIVRIIVPLLALTILTALLCRWFLGGE